MKKYIPSIACLILLLVSLQVHSQYTLQANLQSNASVLQEGCSDMIVFNLSPAADEDLSFNVEITGVAESGEDYTFSLGNNLVFLDGENQIAENIIPLQDGITEGPESIIITISGPQLDSDFTFSVSILDQASIDIANVGDTILACRNNPIELTATGNAGNYSWSPEEFVSDPDAQTTSLSPEEDMWFYVEGEIGSCVVTDSLYVNLIDPVLNVFTSDPTELCLGESIEINADTNFPERFEWNNKSTLSDSTSLTPVATPTESLEYIGSISFFNCTIRDTLPVRVDSLPEPGLKAIPPTEPDCDKYCKGDVIKITDETQVMEENYPDIEYQWENDPTIINGVDTLRSILVELDTTRTYVRSTTNGMCSRTDSIRIEVIDTELNITPSDTTVCADMPVQVQVSPDDNLSDIEWEPTSGLSCTDCLDPVITTSESTTYTVKATKEDCCPVQASITVNVEVPPIPIDPVLTCPGESVQIQVDEDSLELTDPEWVGATNNLECTDCFDPLVENPSTPMAYTLNAYDEEGCLNQGTVTVSFYDSTSTEFEVEPGLTVSVGADVSVTLMTDPMVDDQDFDWFYNDSETNENGRTATFTVQNEDSENVIRVEFIDNNGCEREAMLVITGEQPEVQIPNAFSPNNDGDNDFFRPLFKRAPVSGDLIEEFIITNRFGKVVYNNDNPSQGWDGRINGSREAPPAVYMYRVKLVLPDGTEYTDKGDVTLIR